MIPLSPLSPIQRIGYLDGEILCREAVGPFVPGRMYRVATRVRPTTTMELSLDALGRQNKIDLRSKETLVVIDSEAGPRGFTPDTLRRCCTNVPLLGDYQALLRCFEIPDVPDVARVFPAEMAAALGRVADLQAQIALRRPGFSFLPYQRQDLARACLSDGVLLAWMTGLGKALALFAWPLLKLGWLADDILYPPEPALIIAPDELLEQHREECKRFLGVYPMVLTRFDGVFQEGLFLTGYHKLTRNIDTLQNPAAFAAVAMDEGTKIKSADSLIGRAARTLAPRYRMIATATPIKNRIQDLFWLLWWVAGAKRKPHPGCPHSINGQDIFARWHLTQAINRTRAAEAAKKTGYYRGYARSTARACNLPHLWRIAAPYLLRRRKEDVAGMVAKIEHQIVLPMNPEQERVYRALLDRPFRDVNGLPATFAKLQALRVAAVVPNCRSLPIFTDELSTPKLEECLRLISEIVTGGEPGVVFS